MTAPSRLAQGAAQARPPRIAAGRKLLRDATHAEHVRLNQHPLLADITRPSYSLDMYRQVLAAYFHFYRALENEIDLSLTRLSMSFDYGARRKLQWLEQDLHHFGIDPESTGYRPVRPLTGIVIPNEGALVGTLYTIEGSSLGGQVISRHLAANLGLTPERGARFFYGYGDDILPYWTSFETYMESALTREEHREPAQEAARRTFALMEHVLDEYHARFHD